MRARLAFVVIALLLGAGGARAQFFSPGPLARPHEALEGSKCGRCHDDNQRLTTPRCLACHTEIATTLQDRSGFHGRLPTAEREACQRCHPDHRGVDFPLVDWPGGGKGQFDHARAGWTLGGKHAGLPCQACHDARRVVVPEIARLLRAQPGRATFLGLSKRCDACHFDEHRDQLAHDCQRCHLETSWKPAPRFDHAQSSFPLRGKHGAVACTGCHATLHDDDPTPPAFPSRRANTFLRLTGLEHTTCATCHEDPHRGSLGATCTTCHSEVGWKKINTATDHADRDFHNKTRYPLQGAHVDVPCRSCHVPLPGGREQFTGLPFGKCRDCHSDAHVGQLDPPPGGHAFDCSACHTLTSFTPARFELEQHALTAFPLEGAHRAVSCRTCHALDPHLRDRVPTQTRERLEHEQRPVRVSLAVLGPPGTPERCSSCHVDPHAGQFADVVARRDCGGCHTTTSFQQVKFDHATGSRFPLTGAHARAACASCHKAAPQGGPDDNATPVVRYKPLATTCGSCHRDPHVGQFDAAAATAAKGCDFCHATTRFTETTFKHDDARFTTFALAGRHATLACGSCHREVHLARDAVAVRYRPLPRTCSGCHADFHKGDFRGFVP